MLCNAYICIFMPAYPNKLALDTDTRQANAHMPTQATLDYAPSPPAPHSLTITQVHALAPDVHIFGHTHWEVDVTIGRTRFVQRPLGYPRERRDESFRVSRQRPSGPEPGDVSSACALVWQAQ